MQTQDLHFMQQALRLAARHLGRTWPNPSVGCVLVKHGEVIGTGITGTGGRPHAETQALKQAGDAARGATAYVTLEPCSHHGQTPPCAEALIQAGIARVVIACRDPDPRVTGKGIALLRQAGIEVTEQVCEPEATLQHAGFFSRLSRQRPWVTLKIAASLDGRIALANGHSQWITGEAARHFAHHLRSQYDAIAIGSGTALIDNPALTCRLPGLEHTSPVRVIFDRRLRLPATSLLATSATQTPSWVITSADALAAPTASSLQAQGVRLFTAENLPDALRALAQEGITRLLVEGGAGLATALLQASLIDELYWLSGPLLLGADSTPALAPLQLTSLDKTAGWQHVESRTLGTTTLIHARHS